MRRHRGLSISRFLPFINKEDEHDYNDHLLDEQFYAMFPTGGCGERAMPEEATRRLAAILMADIVGYSRLMGNNERGTHQRVQQLQRELLEPTIAEHRGRLVKTRGDGFLAMFDSPVECVRCAIVIQQSMVGRNLELPQDQWIRFRIGVNLGDVIVEPNDIYGDGVNVAARLEQLAEPGSIYISGGVFEMVRYRLVCGYASLGDMRLKNITDPVEIYRVLPDPAAVASVERSRKLRWALLAGGAAVVLVGAFVAYAVLSPTQTPQPPLAQALPPHPAAPPPPAAAPPSPPPQAQVQPAVEIVPPPPPPAPPPVEVKPPPVPPPAPKQEALVAPPPKIATPLPVKGPPMVRIEGGTFQMGSSEDASEQPIHKVTVGPFFMAKYPVTVREWRTCVAAKACANISVDDDDAPMNNVSWNDAQQFVTWLSHETHEPYRLPTEAEWEFAARGGTDTRYWWGKDMKLGLANCKGCGPDAGRPMKVGTRQSNPFGLYDINSGVTEWVEDCWYKDYRGAPTNGAARVEPNCSERVLRGAGWNNDVSYARPASRDYYDAGVRYPTHGLRVARSP